MIKVLLYGHIDLNVIDGSSFFLASAAKVMAADPNLRVDLLSSKPIVNAKVVGELEGSNNITVLDPYQVSERRFDIRTEVSRKGISQNNSAELVAEYSFRNDYDMILIRDTRVARISVESYGLDPQRLLTYVTGVTNSSEPINEDVIDDLLFLVHEGARFAFQTTEMRELVEPILEKACGSVKTYVFPPMIQDNGIQLSDRYDDTQDIQLSYVGKFFPAWNPIQQIVGFREAKIRGVQANMHVAGDYFGGMTSDRYFEVNTRYLLENTKDLKWWGGVSRAQSIQIVADADLGLSWREASLDDSLELSTKVLEYGINWTAPILNPTKMHKELFGEDYPFYVDDLESYISAIQTAYFEPEVLRSAKVTAHSVASRFSYENSSVGFGKILLDFLMEEEVNSLESYGHGVYSTIIGGQERFLIDWRSKDSLRILLSNNSRYQELDNIGPFHVIDSLPTKPDLADSHTIDRVDFETVTALINRRSWLQKHFSNDVRHSPLRHDEIGYVGGKLSSLDDDTTLEDSYAVLESKYQTLAKDYKTLESRLAATSQAAEVSSKHLAQLRSSKLGRIQVAYWRRRS